MAQTRVKQQVNKPFVGKPYLKYGQCFGLWAIFPTGWNSRSKAPSQPNAFGHGFSAQPVSLEKRFFTEVANDLVSNSPKDLMTFGDYVSVEFSKRAKYTGDPAVFFIEHSMDKLPPETAAELAWQYADEGAAL
jgi:hypothetical protein